MTWATVTNRCRLAFGVLCGRLPAGAIDLTPLRQRQDKYVQDALAGRLQRIRTLEAELRTVAGALAEQQRVAIAHGKRAALLDQALRQVGALAGGGHAHQAAHVAELELEKAARLVDGADR